jgi:hypothetical protein
VPKLAILAGKERTGSEALAPKFYCSITIFDEKLFSPLVRFAVWDLCFLISPYKFIHQKYLHAKSWCCLPTVGDGHLSCANISFIV